MKKRIGFLKKDIKRKFGRFVAVLLVIAISVGFLTGLVSIAPNMEYTADKYYDENNFWDINIKSTLGFTAEDIAAIQNEKYVEQACGIISVDAMASHNFKGDYPVKINVIDFDTEVSSGKMLSPPVLVDGSYPINSTSCVVVRSYALKNDVKIGDKIYLNSGGDVFSEVAFIVTGIVESAEFASGDKQVNALGNNNPTLAIYVSKSVYTETNTFTDALVTVKDADKLDAFGKDYAEKISDAKQKLQKLAKKREKLINDAIADQQQSELGDLPSDFNDYKESLQSQLTAQKKYVNKLKADIDKNEKDLTKKRKALAATKTSLDSQAKEIEELKAKGETATEEEKKKISQYEAALKKYKDDDEELTQKENTLKVDKTIYEQAKKSYDKNLKETNKELSNAQNQYDDYKGQQKNKQSWFIADRTHNAGFLGFKTSIDKITTIAYIFSSIFFVIALAVVLVMNYQNAKDQSKEIGILKSAGYTDRKIVKRYINYSLSITLLGTVLGIVIGILVLPLWIYKAYDAVYLFGPLKVLIVPEVVVPIIAFIILCAVITARFIRRKSLEKTPAGLVLDKNVQNEKSELQKKLEIFASRINGVCKNFLNPTLRDGKRFIVTALGIACCTVLLFTGLGLKNSTVKIDELQYEKIQKYDMSIFLKESVDFSEAATLKKILGNKDAINVYSPVYSETVTYTSGNNETLSIVVPLEQKSFNKLVYLKARWRKKPIDLNQKGVVLSRNTAIAFGVKVGDTLSLRTSSGVLTKLKVGAITKNYVGNFIYVSPAAYKKAIGSSAKANCLIVDCAKEFKQDKFEQSIKNTGLVKNSVYVANTAVSVEQRMENIKGIIQFVILASIIFNFIVTYFLIDINLSSRKGYMAALKEVGFTLRESVPYLCTEIAVSALIGIIAGLIFGTLLHFIIVFTYNTADIMLIRSINVMTFIWTTVVSVLAVVVGTLAAFAKIKIKEK